MAAISRAGMNQWSIKALGYYTKNTWQVKDQEPLVQKLMRGDYSGVKILKDGEFDGPRGRARGGSNNENEGCCNIF